MLTTVGLILLIIGYLITFRNKLSLIASTQGDDKPNNSLKYGVGINSIILGVSLVCLANAHLLALATYFNQILIGSLILIFLVSLVAILAALIS